MGWVLFKLLGIIINTASFSSGTQGHSKMRMRRWKIVAISFPGKNDPYLGSSGVTSLQYSSKP